MAVQTTIPRGTLLGGKYRVDRELGRGGMAAVYEATNQDIGKRVAIKLLAGHLAASQTVVERFLREARAVSTIRSAHICDVYDSGRLEDGTPFLVMELLEGESLYDAMCRDRQMSPEVTLAIILQVARGLAKAHDVGIVHRDLKPENIFLTVDPDGHLLVKILDFGLAKFYDPVETTGKGGKHARLTREGAVFGTPAYMSPEQVRGQAAADIRADLWALACITYECFTGTTVWSTDEGVAMTFAQIATAPLPDPRKYRPDLPQSFNDWFARALDRDITRRFQTVQEFADGLVAAFDYEADGLDAGLINDITQRASHAPDADAITNRRASRTRPRPPAGSPASSSGHRSTSSQRGPTPHSGLSHPGPSSGPTSSGAPHIQQELLVVTEPPPRSGRLRIVGVSVVVLGMLLGILVLASGEPLPKPDEVKRFGEAATRLAHAELPQESGFQYVAKHPWLPLVREAQALIAQGEHDRALSILRRVYEQHRHGMIRNLMDQVQVAVQARTSGAPCQVTGLARPRRYDLLDKEKKPIDASAPAIVRGLQSTVMIWADDLDGPRRAQAVPLDESMRNQGLPVQITPEGTRVYTPELMPVAKRFFGTYWDSAGANAGVYTRWLEADGVIAGPPVAVTKKQPGAYFASAARLGEGFVVVWADRVDSDSVDLFLRVLDKDGKPTADAVRLSDFVGQGAFPARARDLSVGTLDDTVFIAFELVRGPLQQIRLLSLKGSVKPPGLEAVEAKATKDRVLGSEITLTPSSEKNSQPRMACNKEGCFVTWHMTLPGGAGVAFIEGKSKKRVWHKRFTTSGRFPTVSASPSGDVRLAWVEGGRLTSASLGREGVGTTSRVARVVGDQAAPSLAAGTRRGEWYVSWLDFEQGHREPYAIRMQCQ